MRAFEWAAAVPWAIEEYALREILRIAQREQIDPEAVALRLGRPLDKTRNVTVRDGVAVVPITGPIFRYANLFSAISGATSVELLARDINQALDDPAVDSVLLSIDSPGGQVNGIHELGEVLYRARGRKPFAAYVSGTAASAAYWLASAAGRIAIDATARLGSIGVAAAIWDSREKDAREGVERIEIVSSNAPEKRPDPRTEAGRASILAELDRLEAIFIGAVARNRGTDRETVLAEFGRGGIRLGADAVAAGMADSLSSFEDTLAGLSGRTGSGRAGRITASGEEIAAMTHQTETHADNPAPAAAAPAAAVEITAEMIRREHPRVADEIATAAAADAVTADRARMAMIDELALPGHEALAGRAKADGMTVEAFLVEQTQAERARGGRRLADFAADAADLPAVAAVPTDDQPADAKALAKDARALVDSEAREGREISYAEAVRRISAAA